jgi:oxygen-independent coproporphyrinogen III oxidase
VTRISLGAQSFQPTLLAVLERRARPGTVHAAFSHLREAGFDNVSLDLIYGVPGQSPADLALDLAEAIALGPEHLSCYELEAKRGTRFTLAHGRELSRQADAMEGYFELVVETLVGAGFRWYETANFCRPGREARHNLGYWRGEDYLGLGIGAVSTVAGVRWRNRPGLTGYLAALARGERPPRENEVLGPDVALRERLMLGLRLDEPLPLARVQGAVDRAGLARMERLGLAERRSGGLVLTRRGRFLGGGVTAELMAESPVESPAKSTIR